MTEPDVTALVEEPTLEWFAAFVEGARTSNRIPENAPSHLPPGHLIGIEAMYRRLSALQTEHTRYREALTEIVRMGVKFDHRGSHSERVVEMARHALKPTIPFVITRADLLVNAGRAEPAGPTRSRP